ncbi:MAG: DUF3144 domain-containing protein [Halioglobus sp.]|nr:DUF3144 domain-containing protein [Halioglobus sp.]
MDRFIELANSIKDAGVDTRLISHALMSASSVYTTYAYAGNEGGLTQSGIEKVVAAYQSELERIQELKRSN